MKQLCTHNRCQTGWHQKIKQIYLCLVTVILLQGALSGLITTVSAFPSEDAYPASENVTYDHSVQRRDLFFSVAAQEREDFTSWRNTWREKEVRK